MTELTNRPEVDDPRVVALAKDRQQLAYENPFNAVCPPWDGLTEQEQRLSLLDARSYLHAALNAGLVATPAVPVPAADQAALRDRIRRVLAQSDGFDFDSLEPHDYQIQATALLAVLPAPADRATEIERMRERHKASLRRADEINNELMEEVQRYAAGTERPVLWSVYHRMHLRAIEAEAELKKLRRVAAESAPADRAPTLRELEQQQRPNTPPSRPDASPTAPPVKQRADCTELEWAVQERARFERLYTRETVRADLAEQRADTAARDADIYQQRLERLGEGYTEQRKRAEKAEADANHNADLVADAVQRAEQAEVEAERLRTDRAAEFTAADLVAALRSAGAEKDKLHAKETAQLRAVVARLRQMADYWEQQLPDVIRTPAVVAAIRAALEAADDPSRMADEAQQPEAEAAGWHLTPQTLDLFVRALVNEVDYDIHKGYECGEEDGLDHYPELVAEAAEMLDAITSEQAAVGAQQPKKARPVCNCDYIAEPWIKMDHAADCPAGAAS